MARPTSYMIQIKDTDIEPMIKALAAEDMRTIGNEVAYLIRKEYYSRNQMSLEQINSHASSIADNAGK